jgi:YiiM-like, 3-alpha helix domain/Oxidoreductase FAD-binding domain
VITEGPVQAGDQIVRTRVGRHGLSVADVDALLYLPERNIERLRAAVDIPALIPGWQRSFRELVDAAEDAAHARPAAFGVEPGWSGFRRLRVANLVADSAKVTSLYLTAEDGGHLPEPRAGQYITLRAVEAGDPPPVRSYSLSSTSRDTDCYRISVKREPQGMVSAYLHTQLRPGTILEVAAPRGQFVLTDEPTPALLISAGIGVTPVLAMLQNSPPLTACGRCGGCTRHVMPTNTPLLERRISCSNHFLAHTNAFSTPLRKPTHPAPARLSEAVRHSPHSAASACRRAQPPMFAVRPRS